MVILKGSDRQPVANAVVAGPAHPDERLEITLVMRPNDLTGLQAHLDKIMTGTAEPLSRHDYTTFHATSNRHLQKVHYFADNNSMKVVSVDANAHRMILAATVAQANVAFGVTQQTFNHPDGSYRGHTGPIHLPPELDGIVNAVLGLDNRPIARPHFRAVPHVSSTSYLPTEIAKLYDFPPGDGHGQCIALIELGGGYKATDLNNYFINDVGLPQAPSITAVSVDHAQNAPTNDASGPDGEVMLDIEVAGSVAPGAKIAVYFTVNTDAGFYNAITTALHDKINHPTVISISWGGPEADWTTQSLQAFDAAFKQAAVLGVNVCVASGDNGSSDGLTDGRNHVDFPASSPHVLACGGSSIQASNGSIINETVWNNGANGGASGGGFSNTFFSYDWQKSLTYEGRPLPSRGVPDVCGVADPATGYIVVVEGKKMVFGGTSAVAPLWAALIAIINSNRGKNIGYNHATLYAGPSAFHDITVGNNGFFAAASGWDACCGLGSPNGQQIAALFH